MGAEFLFEMLRNIPERDSGVGRRNHADALCAPELSP